MNDCVFCKIIAGEIPAQFIYQDDTLVVFRDIRPKADVHLLIVSREHIKSLEDARLEQADLLSHMILVLPKLAKMQSLSAGFRTIINTGRGGGQEIDHLHFHLLGGHSLPGF